MPVSPQRADLVLVWRYSQYFGDRGKTKTKIAPQRWECVFILANNYVLFSTGRGELVDLRQETKDYAFAFKLGALGCSRNWKENPESRIISKFKAGLLWKRCYSESTVAAQHQDWMKVDCPVFQGGSPEAMAITDPQMIWVPSVSTAWAGVWGPRCQWFWSHTSRGTSSVKTHYYWNWWNDWWNMTNKNVNEGKREK